MEDVTRCKGNYFRVDETHICWTSLLASSQMLSSGNTSLDWEDVPRVWRNCTDLGWEKAFFSHTPLKFFKKKVAASYLWKSLQGHTGQWSGPRRLWIQILSQDRFPSENCTFFSYTLNFLFFPLFISQHLSLPSLYSNLKRTTSLLLSFHILLIRSCFFF